MSIEVEYDTEKNFCCTCHSGGGPGRKQYNMFVKDLCSYHKHNITSLHKEYYDITSNYMGKSILQKILFDNMYLLKMFHSIILIPINV